MGTREVLTANNDHTGGVEGPQRTTHTVVKSQRTEDRAAFKETTASEGWAGLPHVCFRCCFNSVFQVPQRQPKPDADGKESVDGFAFL